MSDFPFVSVTIIVDIVDAAAAVVVVVTFLLFSHSFSLSFRYYTWLYILLPALAMLLMRCYGIENPIPRLFCCTLGTSLLLHFVCACKRTRAHSLVKVPFLCYRHVCTKLKGEKNYYNNHNKK